MSRIGKQPIKIPIEVKVTLNKNEVVVIGPKGELSNHFNKNIKITIIDNNIIVEKKKEMKTIDALWGTTRALIQNMIIGVSQGFEKILELHGVGYKMALQGKKIIFNLGFSHPIELLIPTDLKVLIEKEILKISGVDKQKVGQFAAEIRAFKKVEPYKGKGFRYQGEEFIRKEGKKAVGAE
jgi:large subunit ribosomal protein L6